MKKFYQQSQVRFSVLLLALFFFAGRSHAQVPVSADPGVGSFDITTMSGVPVNANALVKNIVYKLKLFILNGDQLNAIPPNTVEIRIGLGSKMIVNPAFNLATAPFNNYFTWTSTTIGSQMQISGVLHTALPPNFAEELEFEVKPSLQGSSTVTRNFLVVNNNPDFVLSYYSNNNFAYMSYSVAPEGNLPVSISKFAAVNKDCKIQVSWTSEQEQNLARYEIEGSKDGFNFFKLGEVSAQGNRDYSQQILLTDAIKAPVLLIRLKSVDLDDTYKYSSIVSVSGTCKSGSQQAFFAYPNPVRSTDHITIAARGDQFNGTYQLTLTDVAGRVYAVKDITLNAPSLRYDLSPSLAAGKYFISIRKADGSDKSVVQFEKL
ncbi:MAG TPA: T9SS type A sorting domain-containing protein [Chitinophagales bacterium]|nr:T9SS type A sorting domain-containing protein [Chitinophagales bacterium]